ncbi:MAG: S1 RNA-binding domain-containing protein [Acholeplasmataceae bacterium]|nr:S1 RNA-binding domain-containing protein [Acholeplasmataceae bacterium]
MAEIKEMTMDDVEISQLRKGQLVKGKIFMVDEDVITVTLENNQEARMYKDHYGKPIDSFIGEVKEGDEIEAIVSSIKESDENISVLLDRKAIVKNENLVLVEEVYRNETVVDVKITKVDEKGLHVNVLGFDAFLPYGLLDRDLVQRKDELKGETLSVNIIEVKPGRRPRIIASRKKIFEQKRIEEREKRQELRADEFENINTGDVLEGRVERIEKHMAVVRFEYTTGRLRISQIQHERVEDINDHLKVGDIITVKVIKKDKSLDLSMKALLPTPFELFEKNYKKGDKVTGEVVQKLPFGLIIELNESVRGLLHKSEYSWNPNDNFSSYVKISDKLETVITLIDPKKHKISLSRRLLTDNPWKNVNFKRGEDVKAKVLEVTDQGLLVEAKGVDGFIPVAELAVEKVTDPNPLFAVGDEVEARVIEVNPKNWHLKLSIKQKLQQNTRDEYAQYLTEDSQRTTIGDLFGAVLEDTEDESEE